VSATGQDLILVEILDVTGDFAEVSATVPLLLRRIEREGVPGLRSMHFYTRPDSNELAAVIRFSDPRQIQAHTDLLSKWEEFQRFGAAIRLREMRVHGSISAEVQAWIAKFGGTVAKYEQLVGAFERPLP
jgi:hypothetical protein